MRLSEYRLRSKAYSLKREDDKELLAIASFYHRAVDQVSENGKYKIKKIEELIDVSQSEEQIFNEEKLNKVFERLHTIVKRAKERE